MAIFGGKVSRARQAAVIGCAAGLTQIACGGDEDTGAGYAPAATPQGYVFVGQANDPVGDFAWAWTRFYVPSASETCTTLATLEGCSLIDCPRSGSSTVASSASVEAGKVTITAQQTLELVRQADGTYPMLNVSGALWTPDQTITIMVEGAQGDPPAFTATLKGPGPVTVTQPADTLPTVDRSQGLGLVWEGGTSGYVHLQNVPGETDTTHLFCQWPVADQGGHIAPLILTGMPTGALEFATIVHSGLTMQTLGGWTFVVAASLRVTTLSLTLE